MRKKFVLLSFMILFYPVFSYGQTKIDPSEITSAVPELGKFHEIIYPIWHDAYPSKNYTALKSFVPQIKASVESINKVKLPGILRDKEAGWKKQLEELNASAQDYYNAVNNNDDAALLSAAERLHSSYEKMNRVIRPALKEVDDYHQILYVIYHKLYPEGKYDEIAKLTVDLVAKAEAVFNYPKDKLKQRLGANIARYDEAAKQLLAATITLKDSLNGNDPEKKKEAVENLHKAYQELDSVFS